MFAAGIRSELAGINVRVTALEPGLTVSELAEHVSDPDARAGLDERRRPSRAEAGRPPARGTHAPRRGGRRRARRMAPLRCSRCPGAVAEWLRSGLQSRAHRFDSGRRLS